MYIQCAAMTSREGSRLRVDGDSSKSTVDHYLSISSGDRQKSDISSSNDCEIQFDELQNVLSIELINFELPHTKYAIDDSNNTLYLSEKISDTEYNFFGLKVGTSGYHVTDLAVSLELSQRCPIKFSTDEDMLNTYSFVVSSPTGKVAVLSSGDRSFNIHNCQATLQVTAIKRASATEATVKFLAPFENILAAGAMLRLRVNHIPEIDIQVISIKTPREVTVIGDFTAIDEATVDLTNALMIPLSSENCVSEVIGFGVVDFQPGMGYDSCAVLGMQSPFSSAVNADSGLVSAMVCVDLPAFVSTDDHVRLEGTHQYIAEGARRVSVTHDDTHFELEHDPAAAFGAADLRAMAPDGNVWDIVTLSVEETTNSEASVVVQFAHETAGLSVGDSVTILGLTGDHWELDPSLYISSVHSASEIRGVVGVPSVRVLDAGSTRATPVNATTGFSTMYVGPNRYDLSKGRRIILCRMVIDDLDVGRISIPNSRIKFFGRIQLFSGADLVNFLVSDNARGEHTFNSLVKRLRGMRLRFYNDDGSPYNFEGVDFSMLLKVICLNSNTGI